MSFGSRMKHSLMPARVCQVRILGCISILAMLAACATNPPIGNVQEAPQEVPRDPYAPPGPPSDPWGPYIVEASQRYRVPERWIREVMRAESNGKVIETSRSGAMGLMQMRPQTYKSCAPDTHSATTPTIRMTT